MFHAHTPLRCMQQAAEAEEAGQHCAMQQKKLLALDKILSNPVFLLFLLLPCTCLG